MELVGEGRDGDEAVQGVREAILNLDFNQYDGGWRVSFNKKRLPSCSTLNCDYRSIYMAIT